MDIDFSQHHEDPYGFSYVSISGIMLYTPRNAVRVKIRDEAERHLRKKFQPGDYDEEISNSILKYLFDFYNQKLDNIIQYLYCKDWLAFILYQYELSGKVVSKYKEGILEEDDYNYWNQNGPLFRQTADYLADKFVEHSIDKVDNGLDPYNDLLFFDEAWICASLAAEYSNSSNITYFLIPGSTYISILSAGNEMFIKQNTDVVFDECIKKYLRKTNDEILLRAKYGLNDSFDKDLKKHIEYLDQPIKSYLGISYAEILFILTSISLATKPITDPRKIPMVDLLVYFKHISEDCNCSEDIIHRVFQALILKKKDFEENKREIWNYRQTNRVSKKPFLLISFKGREYLMWSNEKLKDFFSLHDLDVTFNNFPKLWSNAVVQRSLKKISNKAGEWLENIVKGKVLSLGIIGDRFENIEKEISKTGKADKMIGEIDFLGYSQKDKAIVIFECKFVNTGFESRGFRQDRDKFLKGDDSYVNKFVRKINWVLTNRQAIFQMLKNKYRIHDDSSETYILGSFITHYSSIAPCFFNIIPCISLVQILEDYSRLGKWPYDNGVFRKKLHHLTS